MRKYNLLLVLMMIIGTCFSQTDDFYYYKGEKVNLPINNEMFYVVLSDTVDWKPVHLNEEYLLSTYQENTDPSIPEKTYWKIIRVEKKNAKTTSLLSPKALFGHSSKVLFVGPVIGEEYPVAVSEFFYVKLKSENDYTYLNKLARENNCEIMEEVPYMPLWYTLRTSPQTDALTMSNKFYNSGYFENIDPGFMLNFQSNCTNDPDFYRQWGLRNANGIDIKACDAWNVTRGSSTIKVAVVDEGIDSGHRDFANNLLTTSYDAMTNTSPAKLYDDHGTHVAGIIGANQNNEFGSGVAPLTSLMSISHTLTTNPSYSQQMASGISWAWQHGADIINNSWGDQGRELYIYIHSTLLENAIDNAIEQGRNGKGCIVTFASGNIAPTLDYPGNYRSEILCVGSLDSNGKRVPKSAYGSALDVVAPGQDIWSTLPNNSAGYATGTSMACPHVSGVAALILAVNPNLTGAQVRDIIEKTARKVGGYSYTTVSGRPNGTWNNEMGYGLIDAYAAVQAASPNEYGSQRLMPGSKFQFTHPNGKAAGWSVEGASTNITIQPSTGLLTNHDPKFKGSFKVKGVNSSSLYTSTVTISDDFLQGYYEIGGARHTFSEWYPSYPLYAVGLNVNETFSIHITSPLTIDGKSVTMSWKQTEGNLAFTQSGSSISMNPSGRWGRILLEAATSYGTMELLFCINVGAPANLSVAFLPNAIQITESTGTDADPKPFIPLTLSGSDKQTNSLQTIYSYEIVSLTASRSVLSGSLTLRQGEQKEIDLSTVPSGYYILNITDGNIPVYSGKFGK